MLPPELTLENLRLLSQTMQIKNIQSLYPTLTNEDFIAAEDLLESEQASEPIAPAEVAPQTTASPQLTTVPQPDANGEFTTPADGAKFMASLGVPQIPLKGKAPVINDWPEKATTDFAQIDEWYRLHQCNFGGVAYTKEGGHGIFEADSSAVRGRYNSEAHEDFAITLTVISTQNDAENVHKGHRYYQHTAASIALGNVKQDDKNQFSFRANNQYCVSPGSVHPKTGRQYRVASAFGFDFAPIPDTMVRWLQGYKTAIEQKETPRKRSNEGATIPFIKDGGRNNYLFAVADKWHKNGVPPEDIESLLLKENQKMCAPPLDEAEVKATAASACSYEGDLAVKVFSSAQPPLSVSASPAEWPEPRRFESSTVEALPFQLEYLPVAIRDWAEDLAERMSVPLDFTGIASLVTLAGCMNRRVFVHPLTNDQSWREPVTISGAVIASSGRKKTPVWRQFTNSLVEIELKWAEAHQQCVQTYKKAHAEWKGKQKQANAAKKPFDEPEPQEPSPKQRLIMNGATPEALHEVMSTNPRGVFVYRDELSGWVAELEKQGYEQSREVFLCAMNGDDNYTMDRISRGTITAKMSASMFGGIQPELFFEFLNSKGGSNVACGLIPRFGLLVYPNTPVLPLLDRTENTIAKSIFKGLLRSLASMGVESLTLHFDKEAQGKFNEWRRSWQLKVDAEKSPAKQSHLNKYVGLVPRLAGLAQVVDQLAPRLRESGDAMLGGFYQIDVDHLNQVLGFIEYLESHLNKIYSHVKNEGQKAEEALSTHLLTGALKDGFTVREITNRKHWAFLKDARTVEYALGSFEELGWVRQLPLPSGGGRPTLKWEINPKLTENSFDTALK